MNSGKDPKDPKEQKKSFDNITVYLTPGLLKEIDDYVKVKKYGNRSAMFRKAFRILKHVFPLDSSEKADFSIEDKLNRIEQQLKELTLQKELETVKEEVVYSKICTEELDVDFETISSEMLAVIENEFQGNVKDFVVTDYFKNKYSRGITFHVLSKLKEQKRLSLKNGVWKIERK